MDNFHVDVTAEGLEEFKTIFTFAAGWHNQVVGYTMVDDKLVLYWSKSSKATPMPYLMTTDAACTFCWNWLDTAAEYGPQPDHDGDNGKGWRIYNEAWGHVDDQWEAFVGVQPRWAMYGK